MSVVPDEDSVSVAPVAATLGNQDSQRNASPQANAIPALDATSRAVTIHFDSQVPWMVTVDGTPSDDAVTGELYGAKESVPIDSFTTPDIPSLGLTASRHYVIDPARLRPEYRARYQVFVDVRKSVLDAELEQDFRQLVEWLDMPTNYYGLFEAKALGILWKWAREPFRPTPPRDPKQRGRSLYLNNLLLKLSNKSKDIGFLTTVWTSYYDLMFNHFSNVDELRQIRDQYSLSFMGDEAIDEVTFGGVLWERVKSGEVRDNIFGFFKGLGDAGVGFFTGLYHMVRHPLDTLEGLIKLPGTLKTLWEHRGELWDQFANASEEDKGRIIGRFFGEIEVILATAGGAKAAGGLPKVVGKFAVPTLEFAEDVTAGGQLVRTGVNIGTQTVTVSADLAKFGKGAAGLSMMSQALDKTSRGGDAADELRTRARSKKSEPAEPAKSTEPTEPAEPPEPTKAPRKRVAKSRARSYPEGINNYIKELTRRFPKLENAGLRPKERGPGPGMFDERMRTGGGGYSFRAKGGSIELDDIALDGTVTDIKIREGADLPELRSPRTWEGAPPRQILGSEAEALDLSNAAAQRKLADQMWRQSDFITEFGLKRGIWQTNNPELFDILLDIKGREGIKNIDVVLVE